MCTSEPNSPLVNNSTSTCIFSGCVCVPHVDVFMCVYGCTCVYVTVHVCVVYKAICVYLRTEFSPCEQ